MQPSTRKEWLKKEGKPDESKKSADRIARERAKRRANNYQPIDLSQEALRAMAERQKIMEMNECSLCCELVPIDFMRTLAYCHHAFCKSCLEKHVKFSIVESRIEVPCPYCPALIHPNDVKDLCDEDTELYAKYEEFSLRAALVQIPDTRWCPAPDCGFAAIIPDGLKCPQIKCLRPECGMEFCFECKKEWQPARRCHVARRTIKARQEHEILDQTRPCPRCRTLIHKIDDGSCNHMICTMCRAEFCWLCLREINDLHYMSPTGCTFWGKRQWSRKKKLMWQLGSLVGSPVVIAATAIVSVPLLCGIIPIAIGRKVYKTMKGKPKGVRVVTTTVAVAGSVVVSPVVAGVTVAICVPIAIGYTYIVVPKALIHDAVDYVRNRRDLRNPIIVEVAEALDEEDVVTEISGISEVSDSKIVVFVPSEPSEAPEPSENLETHRNSDGSPPGPSSASSATDYSEDLTADSSFA